MITIELHVAINAPTDIVWDELSHLDRHTQWMGDAEEITFRSDQRFGIGTSIDCLTNIGPFSTTDVMTVTNWIDGQRIVVDHHGVVSGTGAFELHHDGKNASRMVWAEQLRLPLMFGGPIGEIVAKPLMTFIWKKNLAALRAVCEQRAKDQAQPLG